MKVAIAGAGRGIGAACARELARSGAELILCARTASEVQAVAGETAARAVVADLSTDAGTEAFASAAEAADLAVICVGVGHAAVDLANARRDLLAEMFTHNAVAPALAAGALLRHGAKHLLFLGSLVTRRPPIPGMAPYTASKAALESLVRAFAEEQWPRARANALCLGPVRTRMHEAAGTPREWMEQFLSPQEAARLVLQAAALPGSGRIFDAEALQMEAHAAQSGDGRLAHAEVLPEPPLEAEPGRRPSPRVRAAIRASAAGLHHYPRGASALAARLGELHGLPETCVALSGGGATELLERCLRVFCAPGEEVVSPFPTFEVLSALCSREGVRHRPVPSPRTPDGLFGSHAAAPLLAAAGPRTRLFYVASPDSPTGALLPDADRDLLAASGIPLLLDQAWSMEPLAPLQPRALHLRSFSKLQGLASLRIAYALGPPEQIALLRKLELPFPLGSPQIAAAHAVLDQPERARRSALLLRRERDRVAQQFRALGLAVSESPAPLLLLRAQSENAKGRLLFALQGADAPVQEAHWDRQTLVLALGRRAANRRALSAARRALAD